MRDALAFAIPLSGAAGLVAGEAAAMITLGALLSIGLAGYVAAKV